MIPALRSPRPPKPVPLRPEDLLSLPKPREGGAYELSNGELITVGNAGAKHGRIKRQILKALFDYEQRCGTGEVYAESQFTLGNHIARIPDAAFVMNEKLDLLPDAETKVSEYLTGGTPEVWQVYPKERIVRVRTASAIRDFTARDLLSTPLLPGFEVEVASFFAPPNPTSAS